MQAVWFIPTANLATTLTCSHPGLANCLSTGDHCFADFLLALIHNVLHVKTSLPNLFIGHIYAGQAFIRNPLSSFCSGYWSKKYAQCGADLQSGYQVRDCRASITAWNCRLSNITLVIHKSPLANHHTVAAQH